MTLQMRPPVLIPRPETEELVDNILKEHKRLKCSPKRFLDGGCGTGAISLALLKEWPESRCVAIDINPIAVELTKSNAGLVDVEDRIQVMHTSFEDFVGSVNAKSAFDLVVSNPPYISTENVPKLQVEVSKFEDHGALDRGIDGMAIIRQLILAAPELLCKDGQLWLEVDPSHPPKIRTLCSEVRGSALQVENVLKDFAGHDRFVHLRRT